MTFDVKKIIKDARKKKKNPKLTDLYKKMKKKKNVYQTIVINKPGTYDFKGVLHVWKGKDGQCKQKENRSQILRIEASNVRIKNFFYRGDGKGGSKRLGDPIHVATCGRGQGNLCPQQYQTNVTLDRVIGHACEDMITIGSPKARKITVRDSIIFPNPTKKYRDKNVQVNFGKDLVFYRNLFAGGERCVRLKPRTNTKLIQNTFIGCRESVRITGNDADIKPMKDGTARVEIRDNHFRKCKSAIVRGDKRTKVVNKGENEYDCKNRG